MNLFIKTSFSPTQVQKVGNRTISYSLIETGIQPIPIIMSGDGFDINNLQY